MRSILVIIFTVILAGCETFGDYATKEQLSKIDKIGIASLVGSKISYNYVGLTIFNNQDNLYEIENWDIDKYIVNETQNKLKEANSNIDYLPVTISNDSIASFYKKPETLYELNQSTAVSKLKEIGTKQGFSYAIIASRDNIQFESQVPVDANGLGLRKQFGHDQVGSFVHIKFQLFDLNTGQQLSKMRVFERNRESDLTWLEPYSKNSDLTKARFIEYAKSSINNWLPAVTRTLVTAQ